MLIFINDNLIYVPRVYVCMLMYMIHKIKLHITRKHVIAT